jgi:prephenate dehydratase
MRAGYLGPAGSNSHAALVETGVPWEPVPYRTVAALVQDVQAGRLERGLVPLENSREGAVGSSLDTLVFDAPGVVMLGEHVHRISYLLLAGAPVAVDAVRTVHSHPQALGQCAGWLAAHAPAAVATVSPSTAEAVRAVVAGETLGGEPPHAAIGTRYAAELYGATVLATGIEDDAENATRFAWIAPPGAGAAEVIGDADAPEKTTIVFWGAGDMAPGWLVACLGQFASRGVNLTRIESRPRRVGLGHYMFFLDLEGNAAEDAVAEGLAALREQCEEVRVFGSFPVASA